MIEIVSGDRCIGCDKCVEVCPTNVFDAVPETHPVIARQQDSQTCILCEAYCPADALFVAPTADPAPAGSVGPRVLADFFTEDGEYHLGEAVDHRCCPGVARLRLHEPGDRDPSCNAIQIFNHASNARQHRRRSGLGRACCLFGADLVRDAAERPHGRSAYGDREPDGEERQRLLKRRKRAEK